MNCLPFIKRVANLRSVELQTPSDLNKQVFFSEKRKQRNSTDSGFSSTTDGNHLDLHSTRTPMWRNSISESGSSISTDDSTIKDEYCTTGYDGRRQLHTYLDQASKTWDDSTVFSLSNQKEIDIYLDGTNDYIGISIVGHNFENGDASLFIGAVISGGAVSRDGRIQAGDLLLDINGNSLDGMSSRDAVAMLRQAVQHRRMVTLTVVGSWDDESVYSERSCVRPIDPMQWLAHNNFIYNQSVGLPGNQQKYFNSKSQMSIVSSSLSSSMPSTAARYRSKFHQQAMPLETPTDIVANRLRLHLIDQSNNAQKVTGNQKKSKTSIFGVDLQMWLYRNLRGFKDLAEVENYASHMISCDYLVPTSSYASPALPNKLVEFNRRETYIVKTRPVNNSSRAATPILLMPPISSRSPVQPSHAHKARQEIPRSNTYKFQHRLSESRF